MPTRDRFLIYPIALVFYLFPHLYLSAQNSPNFRSETTDKKRSQEVINPSNPNNSLQENLVKKSKLIKKEEITEECLIYQISYVCTSDNMYETFKNARAEGLFYSYNDQMHSISIQYKKNIESMDLNIFNTYLFKNNHIVSIQLSSCKSNLRYNMEFLNRLVNEYNQFAPQCQATDMKAFK